MADYSGASVSTYFKPKDIDDLRDWAKDIEIEVMERDDGKCAIRSKREDGQWPDESYTGDSTEVNVGLEIMEHLAEGEVVIIISTHDGGGRYPYGIAEAIAWDERIITVETSDIFKLARANLGVDVSAISFD